MSSTTLTNGRFCNQFIRNLAVSFIAKKYNLFVDYSSHSMFNELGVTLFVGERKYGDTIRITDHNFFEILESAELKSNIDANHDYFQTAAITNMLYKYLHTDIIRQSIIHHNPFRDRYNTNNDLCIHIRLGDSAHLNPGLRYYINSISKLTFDKLYVTTDEASHEIIKQLISAYSNTEILQYDVIKTIQFASTCKNIILSHGSFSAVIGYIAFFSNIYYPEYDSNKIWHGDIFSIEGWTKNSV